MDKRKILYMNDNDEICPVNETLNLFNRKWILCIILDLFDGKTHFSEFQEANPTLSNFTLSQTLKYMEEKKLITKITHENIRDNTEYQLTKKSRKANRILYEMTIYALDELECSKFTNAKKDKILNRYKKILEIE
ncbi:helix-turn-helix domain-containing protein [uncultured Methanobrevibacter sp.]|uniref:winged helix-turn-helix transcriptional regulator n=1 Tax=uncultured Methanobrevibacter sp. TaxID=253161 RepID=UPI00261E3B8E|nr:helix-turn-helix domain-containing protein [uncultured Methanobrevibacter sp.]